jgi:septal ring factor EnvC (AmiA/AmiB activator)
MALTQTKTQTLQAEVAELKKALATARAAANEVDANARARAEAKLRLKELRSELAQNKVRKSTFLYQQGIVDRLATLVQLVMEHQAQRVRDSVPVSRKRGRPRKAGAP